MKYRSLGRTGFNVSEISFGAWAIGGSWGTVDDQTSMAAMHHFVDLGGNFIDTADVYGDGRSERLIAQLKKERPRDMIIVATKAGRRLPKLVADGFTRENLTGWVERSLKNLSVDSLDLLQLHTPPTQVFYMPEVFGILDDLTHAGKIRFYGVSVEKVEEGLKAIEFPNVQSVQIIFNMLRLRPAERFLPLCHQKKVGVLARVPLASGLLSGKMSRETKFATDDHRTFNRAGQAFDQGETFSGMGNNLDDAFAAIEELKVIVPPGQSLGRMALRWILMHDGVTCVIPGAKRPDQVDDNNAAADCPQLTADQMSAVQAIYDRRIKPVVHQRW
jgi:aryl-alcohol dehydrogenase-like predicted oxidoreductase